MDKTRERIKELRPQDTILRKGQPPCLCKTKFTYKGTYFLRDAGRISVFFPQICAKKAQYPRKMHFSQKKLADNLVDSEKCISFAIANEEQQAATSKLQR